MRQVRITAVLILAALCVAGCNAPMARDKPDASHHPMTPTYFSA